MVISTVVVESEVVRSVATIWRWGCGRLMVAVARN